MSPTVTDLGKKVKAKYPGQYDDMPDDEVGRRVKAKFPGAYDDFVDTPQLRPKEQAFQQPEGSSVGRFLKGAWDTTVGGIGKAAQMVGDLAMTGASGGTRPLSKGTKDALSGMVNAEAQQANQAADSWKQGHYSEAVGHGLAMLPIVGPPAAHAAERIGGSGQAPQFDKYGNIVKEGGAAPDVAGGLGEAAGLITASSPKNIVGPVATKAAELAGKIPVPERLTPEGMYQSALRPSLAKKNLPKIQQQVATGLKEEIPVSRGGLEKTDAAIDAINDEIAQRLQDKSEELGPVVSPKAVASRVEDVRPTFEEQVNPQADLSALNKSKSEFLKKHSSEAPYTEVAPSLEEGGGMYPIGQGKTQIEEPLTLSEAQAEKQGTYRQLRKKYGELGSADVEAQKSLARGLKEEIIKHVPELASLNARDSALIELQSQLEKMVAREGNKNILGLVPATMSHNPFGFLATLAMDNPAIKSRIAIALNRARKVAPSTSQIGGAAGNIAPAGVVGADANENQIPQFAKGGIIRKPTLGLVGEAGDPEAIVPVEKLEKTAKGRNVLNSLPTPDPVEGKTAAKPTIPETPETIRVQLQQLSAGKRRVVMLPKGTPGVAPKGVKVYRDETGNRYLFHPRLMSEGKIRKAISSNSLPSILGAVKGGMGAPDKSKLKSPAVAVVGKTASGVTTQATATDRPHMRTAIRQTRKVTPKTGSVKVERPETEIARRLK